MTKAVVVYSGGCDSLTVLSQVLATEFYDEVHCVSVKYGQKHSIELEYAKRKCESLGLTHQIVDLSKLSGLLDNSALMDPEEEMPTGHYQAESMRRTVVPNRNAILINVAAAYAFNIGAKDLYMGAHAGDHYIYPDCRPEFISAQARALLLSYEYPLNLLVPFLHVSKGELMKVGAGLGIDYTEAWTCYDPKGTKKNPKACGVCGACVERKESVAYAHAIDNMVYA